jgi:hypothetical protein
MSRAQDKTLAPVGARSTLFSQPLARDGVDRSRDDSIVTPAEREFERHRHKGSTFETDAYNTSKSSYTTSPPPKLVILPIARMSFSQAYFSDAVSKKGALRK